MKILALITALTLTACSSAGPAGDYRPYLSKRGIHEISSADIPHCQGYGCRLKSHADLNKGEWKKINKFFNPKQNAAEERAAIAKAIGQFEKIIGNQTGTREDVAGTYEKLGDFQQDCIDESVNTTIYLELLRQKEWLRHHDISNIAARIPVLGGGGGFHQTAVIVDHADGKRYAVDSWFHDNGHDAHVVPLNEWLYGWRPPHSGN